MSKESPESEQAIERAKEGRWLLSLMGLGILLLICEIGIFEVHVHDHFYWILFWLLISGTVTCNRPTIPKNAPALQPSFAAAPPGVLFAHQQTYTRTASSEITGTIRPTLCESATLGGALNDVETWRIGVLICGDSFHGAE